LINGAGAIADSTGIVGADAIIHVVADTVLIGIFRAVSSADSDYVEHIAVAIAVASGDVGTPAHIDFSGTVANTTGVVGPDAGVNVITNAIRILIGCAGSATIANGIEGRAAAVIIGSVDVVIAGRWICASRDFSIVANAILIDIGRAIAIANAQCIIGANAVIDVVANFITVGIIGTVAIAHSEGIICSNARIHIIADAIAVCVSGAIPSTIADRVELVSIAITVTRWNVSTAACIYSARPVAYATNVQRPYTIVFIVTNPIGIGIR